MRTSIPAARDTALSPFWLRPIDLHEAQRRFDEALAAAPERTAVRAQALLAAAAIHYRSGALPRGSCTPRRALRSPPSSAMRGSSGARSSRWGSSASRAMPPTSRCRG